MLDCKVRGVHWVGVGVKSYSSTPMLNPLSREGVMNFQGGALFFTGGMGHLQYFQGGTHHFHLFFIFFGGGTDCLSIF